MFVKKEKYNYFLSIFKFVALKQMYILFTTMNYWETELIETELFAVADEFQLDV